MSERFPLISVYGSSGSGRGGVREAFSNVFRRNEVKATFVDGESFHRFDRERMAQELDKALAEGNQDFSHFGPEANLFDELEELFRSWSEHGAGQHRKYLHTEEEAAAFGEGDLKPGQFTPWEKIPGDTDILVYEGLHGAVQTGGVDLPRYIDLRIGVAPVINMEWIQKIHRDTRTRGYSEEAVMDTILRRMPDYVHHIVPQFKSSDINFQKVPVVDTSDPVIARDVPTDDECVVVIRFRRPEDFDVDFPYLLGRLDKSWMSRRNTVVVPGGEMSRAVEMVLTPIVAGMMERRGKLAA